MNEALGLRLLSSLMGWEDDVAQDEFSWLRLMARLKYDGYRDFQAGVGFIESLISWLQQFEPSDRSAAYNFVKSRLVYISPGEKQRLVEQLYPSVIHKRLVGLVARKLEISTYQVLAAPEAQKELNNLRRKSLIMGLSDGARLDIVRHVNVGRLSNEQIAPTTQIDSGKWADLLEELQDELKDKTAAFECIFLIDDFTASGSSFLRKDQTSGEWKGKLKRFYESIKDAQSVYTGPSKAKAQKLFTDKWHLTIHHYISSKKADDAIKENVANAKTVFADLPWAETTEIGCIELLPDELCLTKKRDPDFVALTQKYYCDRIETKHTLKGGVKHLGLGYAGCALPVVLEHNTPNNSAALIWAETPPENKDDSEAHAMRPLFRRRQRHIEGTG